MIVTMNANHLKNEIKRYAFDARAGDTSDGVVSNVIYADEVCTIIEDHEKECIANHTAKIASYIGTGLFVGVMIAWMFLGAIYDVRMGQINHDLNDLKQNVEYKQKKVEGLG